MERVRADGVVETIGTVETIVAISTAPGRGGIGIVRLAGPEALAIAGRLVRVRGEMEHARVRRGWVVDPAVVGGVGEVAGGSERLDSAGYIDDAMVTAFVGPRSYTGDTVVEIATHGAPVVMEALVRGAMAAGARLARAGEFTQRAFLAGKIDLTQAEAVQDLIAAQTLDQARVAAQQMGGAIARRVMPAKGELLHLIALLEAGMDFASGELDDVDVVPPGEIAAGIEGVRRPLVELAESFRRGQLVRNGAAMALIGPPNAGKSSLFNRLLERERAIVTPLPGTTRDTVEESVALGGVPVRLIDTAGLREIGAGPDAGVDAAEMQGIARSREALADADLVLLVHDATAAWTEAEREVTESLREAGMERPHLVVWNKVDLLKERVGVPAGVVGTSALTGAGLEELRQRILEKLGAAGAVAESGALNTLRQQEAVVETLAALGDAAAANAEGLPHEVILMDLHRGLRGLDSLTGVTTPDDILARIFSTFCIGK